MLPHDAPKPVGQINAQVKLLMTLSYILAVLISSSTGYLAWCALGCVIMVVLLISGMGIGLTKIFVKRLLALIPFIALCALGLLVGSSIERFTQVVVKSTLCVAAATWLSVTTPFNELLSALKALRTPSIMVAMLAMLYRYIFVLGEEALRMQRAFVSRCPRKLSLPDAKYIGMLTGALLLRAYDRADRIYMAMLSRCFDGEFRALLTERPKVTDWLILCFFTALTFAISIALR